MDLLSAHPNTHWRLRQQPRHAVNERGERAAGMREDDLHARELLRASLQDEVDGRAARLMRVVEQRLRRVCVDERRVDRVRRVHEHDRRSPVQLRPHRHELLVPEIRVPGAVPRVDDDAVCVQYVEGVCDLSQGGGGVEEGGQAGEEAVAMRVLVSDVRAVLVAFPR